MQMKWTIKKKKLFFSVVLFFIPIIILFMIYLSYTAVRTVNVYNMTKTNQSGWKGNIHIADSVLGFSPIPNSQGAQVYPVGSAIPVKYDQDGFRVPIKTNQVLHHPRPLILSLGCSFTFGAATLAKDTYPVLVAQSLQGTSKNAGVCSYGLAQMLLLAERLIPLQKPDYILMQYSPWLVDRATSPFAPSYYAKLPSPYFYEKDDEFLLHPPVFLMKVLELPIQPYRDTPKSISDALSFFWNIGFPLFLYDDLHILKYIVDNLTGAIPTPTNSKKELIKYIYKRVNDIAKENGAKLVIVALGNNVNPVEVKGLSFPPDALFINAQEILRKQVNINHNGDLNNNNYRKDYAHWRGNPPKVIDTHPNERAHKIIADAIVATILEAKKQ
jgi:uncharacterized membrane protein (Fun14 family)